MFTGIVEGLAEVKALRKEGSNLHITLHSPFDEAFKIDQSVAHNGVCLTVVEVSGKEYKVTAIEETLLKTNVGDWKLGDFINLERCLKLGDRLDGHWVQGHVDTCGTCTEVLEENGSWRFSFTHDNSQPEFMTVPKGSICINGVSLTVVDSSDNGFSVAIIPYTFEHTNFQQLKVNDRVNLEFDILGKYLIKMQKMPGAMHSQSEQKG